MGSGMLSSPSASPITQDLVGGVLPAVGTSVLVEVPSIKGHW